MSQPVVIADGLGKRYRIGLREQQSTTFREAAVKTMSAPLRRFRQLREVEDGDDLFWALKDVSFEVERGEVVGLIGRNGAGKSTLLKIFSRITDPTLGEARLRGRVASLLEVGTGFHQELSGRENLYLNGAILGMKKSEINRKFDEIVAFAEIERFLDTPVKRYSSGMYVRLAFAIAAHLDPEILIVDEVLAVGDADFQKKCLGKMKDVARGEGRTVLFVSHNMMAVRSLCSRAIVLSKGKVSYLGRTEDSVAHYLLEGGSEGASAWHRPEGNPTKPLMFEQVRAMLAGSQPNLRLEVDLLLQTHSWHKPAFLAVDIVDPTGTAIMQALPTSEPFIEPNKGIHELRVGIDLPPLIPGRYYLSLWTGSHNTQTLDTIDECVCFDVEHTPAEGRSFPHTTDHGYIVPQSRLHYEHA